MKVKYRLEVEYPVFKKNEKTYFKTNNYIFNSENSIKNRKEAINKYANFKHVFKLAAKTTNGIRLSVTDIVNTKENRFKIPLLNIYYSSEEFTSKNSGTVIFGGYLNDFNERITELEQECKFYKDHNIPGLKTEILEDYSGRKFKIINNSPFIEEDFCRFKNSYKLNNVCV